MRSRLAALLGLAIVASMPMAGAAPAHATATTYKIATRHYDVKTKYGHIYVEVQRPVDPKHPKKLVKGPAILTYSPYSILWEGLCGDRICDASRWVPRGYVRVWADVVGPGNSGGC